MLDDELQLLRLLLLVVREPPPPPRLPPPPPRPPPPRAEAQGKRAITRTQKKKMEQVLQIRVIVLLAAVGLNVFVCCHPPLAKFYDQHVSNGIQIFESFFGRAPKNVRPKQHLKHNSLTCLATLQDPIRSFSPAASLPSQELSFFVAQGLITIT